MCLVHDDALEEDAAAAAVGAHWRGLALFLECQNKKKMIESPGFPLKECVS